MPVATTCSAADARPGLVSVIVPTFNRSAMVRELLRSIEEQAWRSMQVIVVDDGSTDGTFGALERWMLKTRLETLLLRQSNSGPAAARNKGLAEARGEFIYFIDSDDLVLPTGLSAMVAELQKSAAPYCIARVRNVDREGRHSRHQAPAYRHIDPSGIVGSAWPTHGALYRKAALESAGRYNEALHRGEDEELHWRLISACGPGRVIDDVVALRRIHSEGRLSDDMSPAGMGRCRYQEIACFTTWALARGTLRPDVAARCLEVLSVAILRLRVGNDRAVAQAAVKLGHELAAIGARPTFFFRFCSACRSPAVLRTALCALHAGRDIRHAASAMFVDLRTTIRRIAGAWPEPSLKRLQTFGRVGADTLQRPSR